MVGAGPAGLAIAACLKKAGAPFLLIEKSPKLGWAWRNHYERLHLHTVKEHSGLPYFPFPKDFPRYVPRDKVVEYLDQYAAEFGIEPKCGVEVKWIRRSDDKWNVETSAGDYTADRVVICTGYNRRPLRPSWPGQDRFQGEILHSHDYRNGEPFRGRRVLVVGIGNTGGEIAIDLHEHGAEPSICVRGPIHIVPRDALGTPTQVTSIMLDKLPEPIGARVSKFLQRLLAEDLSQYGIRYRDTSPLLDVNREGRVPLIDVGTVGLIKEGRLKVAPGIERFTENTIVFADGQEHPFDAVILATGYRPGLDDFLENAEALVDDRGYPKALDGPAAPGLYFLGFKNPVSGFLRQINIDARALAKRIARESRAVV